MDALVRTRPAVVCAGFGPGRHQADVEKDKQNGLGRANSPARRDRLPPPGRWQSAAGGAGMIRGSPQKLLVGFGLLLIVLVGALQGANLWQEYQREQAVFRERLTAEVRLLAEHARLTLTAADLVLDQLEQVLREHGLENLDGQNGYWLRLRRAVHGVPEFRTLSLNDAQGVNRLTTRHYPGAGRFSISDRDYFLALKEGARSYIGAPILGRSSRTPILPYGRRLEDDEGEFAGIALISLNVRHLQDFYQSAPEGLQRQVGLYRSNGELLLRHPPVSAEHRIQPPAEGRYPLDQGAISLVGVSPLDGSSKIIAYQQVPGYPLVVAIGMPHRTLLTNLAPGWQRSALAYLAFVAATLLIMGLLARALRATEQLRQEQLKLARQQREAQRLAQAIIHHIPNGWVALVDRELRYVFVDGQGLGQVDPVPHLGQTMEMLQERYPSPGGQRLCQLARLALAGQPSEEELPYEGRIYRFAVVPLTGDERAIEHVLILSQDISELKRVQRELEERNRQLQELSLTDGLLDIANRRAFDQTLEREWARCARGQQPIALLMIDIDHFKLYNDSHGHTAGDQCLQRVAEVLREVVTRPADLVARYGGEEFTVLLPECSPEGAEHIAGQIHRQLEAAAIPFARSPTAGQLTVCIGLAMAWPQPNQPAGMLVEAADQALYLAKSSGRNQTRTTLLGAP